MPRVPAMRPKMARPMPKRGLGEERLAIDRPSLRDEGSDGDDGPRAMLWAGMRRSYRTRVVGVVVYPERCSGLVYSVPLGHGGGGAGTRGQGADGGAVVGSEREREWEEGGWFGTTDFTDGHGCLLRQVRLWEWANCRFRGWGGRGGLLGCL